VVNNIRLAMLLNASLAGFYVVVGDFDFLLKLSGESMVSLLLETATT